MTILEETTSVEETTMLGLKSDEEEVDAFPENRIVLYSKPNCRPCKMTKAALTKRGLTYSEVDITLNPEALETLIAEGFSSAPVVKLIDGTSWAGYNPEKISEIPDQA